MALARGIKASPATSTCFASMAKTLMICPNVRVSLFRMHVVCTNVETLFVAVAVNQNRIRRYVHERLTSLAKKRKSQSKFGWLFIFLERVFTVMLQTDS